MLKNKKGNTLLIETEFGDAEIIFLERCISITRPRKVNLEKNIKLFNFLKKKVNFNFYKKTAILIIEKRIIKKNKNLY